MKGNNYIKKPMRHLATLSFGLGALALCPSAAAKQLLDMPVAAPTNLTYLTDMPDRLWWNADWKKRAPLLVSNVSKVRVGKAIVDVAVDLGEKVRPEELRVVTPWETVVPCSVIPQDGNRLEVVFETDFRELENKPFFLYWGNTAAKAETPFSTLTMDVTDSEVRLANGAIDVVLDNLHRTEGLIKSIRTAGSPARNQLLWRTTEFAWEGFVFNAGGKNQGKWSKAEVLVDTPLKKSVRFTCATARLDFTLCPNQSRLDWAYSLTNGLRNADVTVSWAAGGGCGADDLYYTGAAGKVLTMRAALDSVTDCIPNPMYYSFPWLSDGWYAIRDRKTHDVVGMLFDRPAASGFSYLGAGQHSGERFQVNFQNGTDAGKGEIATGSGALVARVGEWQDVKAEHDYLKTPPRVFLGETQDYRPIEKRIPRLDKDFCVNVNVGGWKSSTPLEGKEWATNIMKHIRELGANVILHGQLTDYGWTDLKLTKEQYDEFAAYTEPFYKKWHREIPPYSPEQYDGKRFRTMTDAAHANGLAVMAWNGTVPGVKGYGDAFDPEEHKIAMKMQPLHALNGQDCVFNGLSGGEGSDIPKELKKANDNKLYWHWDNPRDFFAARRKHAELMKEFYGYSKKIAPHAPVMNFTSDNGELGRDMQITYQIGTLDTMLNEFVAHCDFKKHKHTAKRLRAFFDNVDAHTVWHHYYFMNFDYDNRVGDCELPFICGVNGFSQESMTYENFGRDAFEITADFNRLARFTKLGEKAAKMGPVKNLAVLRDMACFEEDICKRRYLNRGWWQASRHDLRVNAFAEIYNYNYDVVLDPFFTRKSLARYNVVYVPDDEVFSDRLAEELVAFVEAGGGAVVEGATATSCKTMRKLALQDGVVTTLGKGRIVLVEDVLTDRVEKGDAKAIARTKELLASVGSQSPYDIVGSRTLDSVLQGSKDGLLLGVYNRGNHADKGKVVLSSDQTIKQPDNALYVLDVKSGVRFPLGTNGFDIAVGPQQCGFYLIGDDAFTAIPKAKEVAWAGPSVNAFKPAGPKVKECDDKDFRPKACVELVSADVRDEIAGPTFIRRSHENGITRRQFVFSDAEAGEGAKNFSVGAFKRALKDKDTAYIHFQTASSEFDSVFAECADALKDFLKAGGGFLFDRQPSLGPNAVKFLGEVGVFSPYKGGKTRQKEWDDQIVWNDSVPTNHAFVTTAPPKKNFKNAGGSYALAFPEWDKAKQQALFLVKLAPDHAVTIVQDKVLGAGKVMFSSPSRSFNDWYECKDYGDAVLSWFIGRPADEHAKKTLDYVGGPGTPVR